MALKKTAATRGNTVDAFRAAHDRDIIVPRKITEALGRMAKEGPEHWLYEADFIKLAGISQTDMGAHRDTFAKHIVTTTGRNPKRAWFHDAKVAAKLRGE